MAEGKHPVTFRTRKLSLPAPMVLHRGRCGRVGRRRTIVEEGPSRAGWPLFHFPGRFLSVEISLVPEEEPESPLPGKDRAVIGALQCVVLDCDDPLSLARFYQELLGGTVNKRDRRWALSDEWVTLHTPSGQVLAFQGVEDHRPPRWPEAAHPQQFH